MSEPTQTRALLRQAIGRALSMPFYKYYGSSGTVVTSTAIDRFTDSELTQPDHFWEGSWVLFSKVAGAAAEVYREAISFISTSNLVVLDRGVTGLAAADTYEILSGWTPFEIHDAINRAIESAFPYFFDTPGDETLVVREDTMAYDISGLSSKPWKLLGIWIEQPSTTQQGTAQAGAVGSITCAAGADLSSVEAGWAISCYDGANAGQWRYVSTADNTTKVIVPTVNFSVAPGATTKYMLWDPRVQQYDWKRIMAMRVDSKEWPSTLYFTRPMSSQVGKRIRLMYMTKPSALTVDASTTIVPEEYIRLKAIALLAKQRIPNNRYDRSRYGQMSEDYDKDAELYKRTNAWQPNPGTIWGESDVTTPSASSAPEGDPMDWRGS